MIFIASVISLLYLFLISAFIVGFTKLPTFNFANATPKNKFSIVVPFRNEVPNLPTLLNSFSKLNYPSNLYEIILVNDDSSDDFSPLIDVFKKENPKINLRVIKNLRKSNSPKKDALNTGINSSNFDWIITTDADCKVPKNWLSSFNDFIIKNKTVFIVAPVFFENQNSFLFHFQNLNFSSLIGATIGSFGINKPFMCNGANLCFKKDAFFKVNGYNQNLNIASGDDIFLLEKMLQIFPKKVHYLKSKLALVITNSQQNWSNFIQQQLRWASKTSSYKNTFAKLVGILVLAENLMLVFFFILASVKPFLWVIFIAFFIIKLLIDSVLLLKTSNYFNRKISIFYILISSLIYPFFNVYVGILSFFKKFQWKGRVYKK
jgi:cellulose synthase/poly-beta-1,6-N-acetylglucosamine synthase-like glycosyltransferase